METLINSGCLEKIKHKKNIIGLSMDNRNIIFVDRFTDDNIIATDKQRVILNKLCNSDELHDVFMLDFYNKQDTMGMMLSKFRVFKLKNGYGQDIKPLDIAEEIFRGNWLKVIQLCEDIFQEYLHVWEVNILLHNLQQHKYNIEYIFQKHRKRLYENFICTVS